MPSPRLILLLIAALLPFLPAAGLADVIPGSDPLEITAAADLREALADIDAPDIHVGTPATHDAIATQQKAQPFTLTDNPESHHIAFRDGAVYIVGASPKGAMNGVYRLMNRGRAALETLDFTKLDDAVAPAFRYRIGDHLRTQKPPPGWSDEDQARWYARHFVNVVWGEKFGPPLPYEMRRKYGLGLMLEASLPPTPEGTHWGDTAHKSPWWDDPANASAIYWWGRPSWYGKVKVVDPFDPVGRQAYLDHFNNLLEQNPDTKILYCIFGDYSWAPNEDSTRVSDGKPFGHTQEEAIREIMRVMREAIGERDVIPAVWMWLLFPKQGKERFMEEMTADGIGVMYNEASDNDCWTYLRDNFDNVALKLGPYGKTKFGSNYIPLVSVGGTCESVRPGVGMPLPHVGATKTLRLYDAGVEQFIIWWGSCEGWAYQANIEVLAELVWNPQAFDRTHRDPFNPQDPEPLIGYIARRDFGPVADDVLRFWEAFDRALVDVNLNGEKTGLQNQSWYQRTGNYLIFLKAQRIPLIPSELVRREKVQSLFPWILRPHAQENWATVRAKLADAIAQLDAIRRTPDLPADVQWRLDTMYLNIRAFHLVFANMHNHMRALQAMERLAHLPPDSPRAKVELLPILADDIANTEALIALIEQFPPNFFLSEKNTPDGSPTRDAEIAHLRRKIQQSRAYMAEKPAGADLAHSQPIRRSGDAAVVELPTTAIVQSVFVHWDQPREWRLELSADGQGWTRAQPTWTTAAAVDPMPARYVRVRTDDASAVASIEVYGPPPLQRLEAITGRLRMPFNPAQEMHELVIPAGADEIDLRIEAGSADRITINGQPVEPGTIRVPAADELILRAAAGEHVQQHTIRVLRNLAIGKPAQADSIEGSFTPANAVDGQADATDDKSRWVSAVGDEHWLIVNLGAPTTLSRAIVIHGHQRATTHAMQAFHLECSDDGSTWRPIPGAAVTDNRANTTELAFKPVQARFVRLVVTRTPDSRARVYELALYGPDRPFKSQRFPGGQ